MGKGSSFIERLGVGLLQDTIPAIVIPSNTIPKALMMFAL